MKTKPTDATVGVYKDPHTYQVLVGHAYGVYAWVDMEQGKNLGLVNQSAGNLISLGRVPAGAAGLPNTDLTTFGFNHIYDVLQRASK